MSDHAEAAFGESLPSGGGNGSAAADSAQILPFYGQQADGVRFLESEGEPRRWHALRLPTAVRIWGSVGVAALVTVIAIAILQAVTAGMGTSETAAAAPWAFALMSGIFYVYATAVIFPFVLFILWRVSATGAVENLDVLSPPFVSIVIPAFDEDTHIARAIDCALSQDYPSFEVIVVDDGSRDLTKYVAGRFGSVLISLRKNGGKAAALNAGLRQAKGDIIVFSDSDSFLDKSALRRIVRHFANQKVGAVAGRVELERSATLAQKLQSLEYIFSQAIMKVAQTGSGASISVCPGPICAFRRPLLVELGGVTNRTLAEDFDLTLAAVELDHDVVFEPDAVAYTVAPSTWRQLFRQRVRWSRGALQVFGQHKKMFFNPRFGALGLFWLPYFLIAGFGGALFEVAAVITIPALFVWLGAPLAMLKTGLILICILELIAVAQYAIGVLVCKQSSKDLIIWSLIIKILNLFLGWTRLVAIYQELKGGQRCW